MIHIFLFARLRSSTSLLIRSPARNQYDPVFFSLRTRPVLRAMSTNNIGRLVIIEKHKAIQLFPLRTGENLYNAATICLFFRFFDSIFFFYFFFFLKSRPSVLITCTNHYAFKDHKLEQYCTRITLSPFFLLKQYRTAFTRSPSFLSTPSPL